MCDNLMWRKEPTGAGLWWRRLVEMRHVMTLHELFDREPGGFNPLLRLVFLTERGEHWDYRPGMKEAVDPRFEWAGPVTKPRLWRPGDMAAL